MKNQNIATKSDTHTVSESPEEVSFGVKPYVKPSADIFINTENIQTSSSKWITICNFPTDKVEWLKEKLRIKGHGWAKWVDFANQGDSVSQYWNLGIQRGNWDDVPTSEEYCAIPQQDADFDELSELDQYLLGECDFGDKDLPFAKYWVVVFRKLEELECNLSLVYWGYKPIFRCNR